MFTGWLDKVDLSSADPDEKEMSWVTVSSLARDQRDRDVSVADESKTVLDWIKEGDVERVRQVCPLMHYFLSKVEIFYLHVNRQSSISSVS